jgi:hypothetical protein
MLAFSASSSAPVWAAVGESIAADRFPFLLLIPLIFAVPKPPKLILQLDFPAVLVIIPFPLTKEPPMTAIELMANSMTKNFEMLKMHLADFSDADLMVRPVPPANHAAWQIGHLLDFEVMTCNLMKIPGAPTLPPKPSPQWYGKEGASSDDASKFMKKEELLKLMAQSHGALVQWARELKPEDLSKPGPAEFKGFIETVGDLVLGITMHGTMHIGQIQVIRRKLGKKILM